MLCGNRECVPLAPAPQSSLRLHLIWRWHKGKQLTSSCDKCLKEEHLYPGNHEKVATITKKISSLHPALTYINGEIKLSI